MPALDEFLQQGALPFVGREAELDRLIEFWRATPYAQRLRGALVQAEAGIGKSRLLDEVMRRVAAEEGAVVHVKLYPESSISLAPLLARALWHSNVGRELLRVEPEGNLTSVTGALRRLSRLRPTLLVFEDTHLLSSESTPELASLLGALTDETLSVLALCRPSEWRGRTVVEGFLVERIELEGLSEGAIARAWEDLFGAPPGAQVARLLHQATLGNALALRSVIRSAIDSRVIVRTGDTWQLSDPTGSFATLMKRNVELLSAGMVAHLSDEELKGASRLASLGEIFSREAADALIGDSLPLLDALMAKGILATTSLLPSPLGGVPAQQGGGHMLTYPSSAHNLLVFTHTLLHKHLAEHARVQPEELVKVIAGNQPLYSLLPFLLLREHAGRLSPDNPDLRTATERSLFVAWLLDQGFDCHTGFKAWETASALFALFSDQLLEGERERQLLRLAQIRLSLFRFDIAGVREKYVDEFMEATRRAQIPDIILFRFTALGAYVVTHCTTTPDIYIDVWNELEELVASAPEYRFHRSYIKCVASVAQAAATNGDMTIMATIRERVEEMLDDAPEDQRQLIEWVVFPTYLPLFSTREELEDRMRLARRLEGNVVGDGHLMTMYKVTFLVQTGAIDAALAAGEGAMRWYREQSVWANAHRTQLDTLMARAALGGDLAAIEAELRALLLDASYRDLSSGGVAACVGTMAVLRGDTDWGVNILREMKGESEELPQGALVLGLVRGAFPSAAETARHEWSPRLPLDRRSYEILSLMLRRFVDGEGDIDVVREAAVELLCRPVLRLNDILALWGVLAIIDEMQPFPGFEALHDDLRGPAHNALVAGLEWLAERELTPLMTPLLEFFEEYLDGGEMKGWGDRIRKIDAARAARMGEGSGRGVIRVSMLGTIQVGASGAELAPLRGVRIRTLLGLMVADQMIGASLTPHEFVQIAGEDDDPELARKKRNMGVVRLREIMGADAILTDGKTPRLNLAIVEVDLLRADELVKRSLAAAREGSWVRAQPLLLEALELTRGEVPFPTLYESFFEAARDDFEFRLRSAVLDVSRGLLREGDTGGAEEILRRAFAAMADDEEIADLLKEALIARGNKVEAERVKMKTEV